MAIKGNDQEQQSLLSFPQPIYVHHRKTKIIDLQNTAARITKIHSSQGGGRQEGLRGRGNGSGRKSIQSNPGMRLASVREELQKSLRSFQTHQRLKSLMVSGRFCLTSTRDKSPDSSKRRECV